MKLFVLGGTRFLGRHIVDGALARGDDVTIFTRGRLPVPWQRGVTALTGDRDPRIAPGLDALKRGTWDAAVDCSGYVPRVVEAGAQLLASRYIFVSSISVYAKTDRPDMDEGTPAIVLEDPDTEQVTEHYGGLKAACEAVVGRIFGSRASQVRLGLIVGRFDASDGFGYWVARFPASATARRATVARRRSRAARASDPARPERGRRTCGARSVKRKSGVRKWGRTQGQARLFAQHLPRPVAVGKSRV